MQITSTISILEIVWVIVSTFGVLFMALLLLRSYQDYKWIQEEIINGDKELRVDVAKTSVLIFFGGTFTQLTYLTTGCIAMTQENRAYTALRITTNVIFISGSAMSSLIAATVYQRRQRTTRLVQERLEQGEKNDGATTPTE